MALEGEAINGSTTSYKDGRNNHGERLGPDKKREQHSSVWPTAIEPQILTAEQCWGTKLQQLQPLPLAEGRAGMEGRERQVTTHC